MNITKQDVLSHVVPAIIGIIIGLCLVKCASKPVDNIKIERDTVVVVDTAYYDRPAPVDSATVRSITRYLPIAKRDTSSRVAEHFRESTKMIEHFAGVGKMFSRNDVAFRENSASSASFSVKDSVLVEVPITSKHYQSPEYDAWVSGYEPSLDSIKVYKETQYITEVRTISKPPNKWELDAVAGIDYNVTSQRYTPYAGGELLYKPSRFQFGIRGGVVKTEKVEPTIGGVVKMRIF